jgi:hypothetical protein
MTQRMKTILISGSALSASLLSVAAQARTDVSPYLAVEQVVDAEISPGSDVLTYTSLNAGINATIETQRTLIGISYNYERRISWDDRVEDGDTHEGLLRLNQTVVPGVLSIDAGALATRARSDLRGDAPGVLVGNVDNVTQVYSAFVGPTVTGRLGDMTATAAYRLGYTKVEESGFVAAPGQPALDAFDDSVTHLATANIGMDADVLPFGWRVSGAYERADASQLDQNFEAMGVRADVTVPITPTVALLGGIGYEDISASQRAPLLDVNGDPVIGSNGRFVTDPASPRLLAYDFDGIYWDVGVGWKPSQRTSLEAHVGRRYGSMSYTGSFSWQVDDHSAFQIGAFDQVETFGQQVNDALALLPTNFRAPTGGLSSGFSNCTFANGFSGRSGGCLNTALSAVNSSVYRNRGVSALYSTQFGRLNTGIGFGWSQRKFKAPVLPGVFTVNATSDEELFGQVSVNYQIDRNSTWAAQIFGSRFSSGVPGSAEVYSLGGTTSYNRTFGRHLSAVASVGVYEFDTDQDPATINASALVGMRYSW